jgi:hypothetical protein
VRVETASPKYFAVVLAAPLGPEPPSYQHDFTYNYRGKESRGLLIFPSTAQAGSLRPTNQVPDQAAITFAREVALVRSHPSRLPVETTTGFTLIGAFVEVVVAPGWEVDYPASSSLVPSGQFIRLAPQFGVGEGSPLPSGTMLLQFRSGAGTLLAILPGFIGVVLVAENRVLNVNYLPVLATTRFQAQAASAAEREKLKALAAVHARYGEFTPLAPPLGYLAAGPHGFDPTLGLYAAYGYAQRGQYTEVTSIQRWLAEDPALPQFFDIELLAARYQPAVHSAALRGSRII